MPKEKKHNPTAARPIAPEDLRPGLYVMVLHVVGEHLPTACSPWELRQDPEPVRILWMPDVSRPLKILDVCLPQVLVADPLCGVSVLDMRQCRLARLKSGYGRRAFWRLRSCKKARRSARDCL